MQVEFKAIHDSSKEVIITIAADVVSKDWEKHLVRSSRRVQVPGFRKGKAPAHLVERNFGMALLEDFYNNSVDKYFKEAVKEHEINYLLYPEVKDIEWEKGKDMVLTIEIEHEPTVEFKQLEGLRVPLYDYPLEKEVEDYLMTLSRENARTMDVEGVEAGDKAELEISFDHEGERLSHNATADVPALAEEGESDALTALIGLKTGDKTELNLDGSTIMGLIGEGTPDLESEAIYPVEAMLNSATRVVYPEIDDEFARDMEYDDLSMMREKVSEELKLANEHKNINNKHDSMIVRLYEENRFEMPMKTMQHIASQAAEEFPHEELRQYLMQQYMMQVHSEFLKSYILKSLRVALPIEVTDEMLEEFYTHQAILQGMPMEAYKDKIEKEQSEEARKENPLNYFTLQKLAEMVEFYTPEPTPEAGIEDAEVLEVHEDEAQAEEPDKEEQTDKPQSEEAEKE